MVVSGEPPKSRGHRRLNGGAGPCARAAAGRHQESILNEGAPVDRKTRIDPPALRSFLELTYEELEELNLAAKQQRTNRVKLDIVREQRSKYLTDEKRLKAVTVCFTDLEGRMHM